MRIVVAIMGCAVLVNGYVAWQLLERRDEQLRTTTALADRLIHIERKLEALGERRANDNRKRNATPLLGRAPERGSSRPTSRPNDSRAATPRPRPKLVPRPGVRPQNPSPTQDAVRRAQAAQSKVLQIADASEREEGIRDLVAMLGSNDQATVWAALRVLPQLRNVDTDAQTWRPLLVRHLESSVGGMRVSAAYALNSMASDADRDVPRYIELAREDSQAELGLAGAAMFATGGRIEGELAALFEELIRDENVDRARDAANYLRGRPATLEVHEAVADAWRRHQKTGRSVGLWFHILGQMKPMHRPIIEVVFETLGSPQGNHDGGLLTGRVVRNTLPEDRPFAAEQAAKALAASTSPHVRRGLLEILEKLGSREQLSAVRDFANNALVTGPEREQAGRVAEVLSSR